MRRVFLWLAGIVAFLALVTCVLLASPLAEQLAARALARVLGADVRVADVAFSLDGRITLRGVEIELRGRGDEGRLCYAPRVVLDGIHGFALDLESVAIHGAEFFARERAGGGFELPEKSQTGASARNEVPRITFENSRLVMSGTGPVMRACRRVLDVSVAPALEHVTLALEPSVDGRMTLRGAVRIAPFGTLAVSGDLTPETGEAHLRGVMQGLRLEALRTRPETGAELRGILEQSALEGRVDLDIVLESDVAAAPRISAAMRWRDGRVLIPEVTVPLEAIEADARFEGGDLTVERADAVWKTTRLDARGRIEDLLGEGRVAMEGRVRELMLGDDLRATLGPGASRLFDDFAPRGPVDLTVRLGGSLAGGALEPEIDIDLGGGSASYEGHRNPQTNRWSGFPFRLSDLRGRIQVRSEGIRIDGLEGRTEDGPQAGSVRIDGEITRRGKAYRIDLLCDDVLVGDKLREAISVATSEREVRAFDQFRPSGRVDARVELVRSNDMPAPEVTVDATLGGISAVYDLVPYELKGVTGHLVIQPGGVLVEGIEGFHGAARIGVDGRLGFVHSGQGTSDLRIHGTGIAIDETLEAALGHAVVPDILEVTGQLGISGQASFAMHLVREAGRKGRFHVDGHITKGRLRPEAFPLPVEDVTADFRLGDLLDGEFVIEVRRLEGERAGGTIRASYAGVVGGPRHLEVSASRQPLDAEFLTALEAVAPAEVAEMKKLEAGGILDITYGRHLDDTGRERTRITAMVHDGRFAMTGLSDPFEKVEGRLLIRPRPEMHGNVVELDDLTARFAGGLVNVRQAQVVTEGDKLLIDVQGRGTDLRLSSELAGVLHEDVRDLFESLSVTGDADVVPLAVHYVRDPSLVFPEQVDYEGEILLRNASMQGFLPARNLRGTVRVEGHRGGPPGTFETRGTVLDLWADIAGVPFEGVRAQVRVSPDGVEIEGLEGTVAGGVIPPERNSLFVGLAAPYPFRASLAFEGCDLRHLLGDPMAKARSVSGSVSGVLDASGEIDHLDQLTGVGLVEVQQGQLWELPVFAELFRKGLLRNLGVSGFPVFDQGHIAFHVEKGSILIDDLVLDSPAMKLTGQGGAGPSGLNVDVVPSVAPSIPLIGLIVDPLFDLIKQGTLTFRVSGPFDNPEITWNPRLLNPFNAGSEPPDWPIMPAPKQLALRERF